MNKALIVYLVNQNKKAARKAVEAKHAVEKLAAQPKATF